MKEYVKLQPGFFLKMEEASNGIIENYRDSIDDYELVKYEILYAKQNSKKLKC